MTPPVTPLPEPIDPSTDPPGIIDQDPFVPGENPTDVESFIAGLDTVLTSNAQAKSESQSHTPKQSQPPRGEGGHPWPRVALGQRHEAIIHNAGWCRQRGYPLNHALLVMEAWNSGNNPPEDSDELRKQVADVFSRYDGPAQPEEPTYVRLLERLAQPKIERAWLIPNFIPAGSRCAILGRWAGGKTWLAQEVALAIAGGALFMGETEAATRSNVVILDGEGGEQRAVTRNNALAWSYPPGDLTNDGYDIYWRSAYGLSLSANGSIDALANGLAELKPVLIIFDTLAKVLGLSDENSNAAAAKITSALYALNQKLGASLLFLSHPAKNTTGESVRGAGELSADLDVLWTIRTTDKVRHVRCKKDRDGDLEGNGFDFTIDEQGEGISLLRREMTDADEPAAAPLSKTAQTIVSILTAHPGLSKVEAANRTMAQAHAGKSAVYAAFRQLTGRGVIKGTNNSLRLAAATMT